MANIIIDPIVTVINSTYLFFVDMRSSLLFLDAPGTYIVWMVIGFMMVPFYVKSVYYQFANPHGHYSMPLMRKVIMGAIFLTAWAVLGYANLARFLH